MELTTTLLWTLIAFFSLITHSSGLPSTHDEQAALTSKIPLEIHIMSKCPDTRDCLSQYILPAMQNVSDLVDFTLSYIGYTTKDDGVECLHGPSECLGNILELCAAEMYPTPRIYLGFAMCLSKRLREIPERGLIENCALEHGISFESLNECSTRDDGEFGLELLRKSFERSESAGVRTSCTVRLQDKVRCVRDRGRWKNCPASADPRVLVRDIRALAGR
ncbi:hypothetical protein K470DRAFT_214158 [Piedraia hortae CBS 480.64]|uniref:Gamma interferon inducible lysosomal thiol reductase n=1 Tax=Piedraia hortae CBS 480.64 TaxID=1314780 RepID=A0A6A7C4S8_9PEZI|nr:hypothetical protein K470DRAFT_214158 [Piedraia hortae CBS 480.64]